MICTPRLDLIPAHEDLADKVIDFYKRNEAHLAPWDPPKPADFYTPAFQRKRLRKAAADAKEGKELRWWFCLRDDHQHLIGNIGLSAIVRGAFQNAMLGYAIDAQFQGQGLMQEGLSAVIAYAFSPEINLHRIQANVRPENIRSLRVLQQLGFEREGFAPAYLFIDGEWRDHVMHALRNGNFKGLPI